MAATLYTRGGPDVADDRGASMVAKHLEKLQREKEEMGMKVVRALIPDLTPGVLALALKEVDWDGKAAAALLQQFKHERSHELSVLETEIGKGVGRKRGGSDASSSGGDSSSSDDSSSDDGGKRKRRRKDKKRKPSGKDKKKRGKDKKKRSKRGKAKVEEPRGAVAEFGKYGIIRESDFERKVGDFQVWAMEVKKVDPSAIPKYEEKELFATYAEDYNTGTLPHKKYYDVAAYEAEQQAKAARKRAKTGEKAMFNDEEERRRELAAAREKEATERMAAAYAELMHTDKAEQMRSQEMLRAQMKLAYRTGDHATAKRLEKRLEPDDPATIKR